jgi:hypothetical protein
LVHGPSHRSRSASAGFLETRAQGDNRVLVDLLGVTGALKFTDHLEMGEQVAKQLYHLDKLASVAPEDKITHTSEKVALMQGVQLRVFTLHERSDSLAFAGHRGMAVKDRMSIVAIGGSRPSRKLRAAGGRRCAPHQ